MKGKGRRMTRHRHVVVLPRSSNRRRRAHDQEEHRRHWLLKSLALDLAARGARPVLRNRGTAGTSGYHLCLHVAGEVVQVCTAGERYLFVTESGIVLGFADDPGVADDLVGACGQVRLDLTGRNAVTT